MDLSEEREILLILKINGVESLLKLDHLYLQCWKRILRNESLLMECYPVLG